jgi:phosphoribosylamine--glycine ligase
LGDPETQPIMMRLKSDLATLVESAIDGKLNRAEAEWDRRTALAVVMAAGGYPNDPRKGDVIQFSLKNSDDLHVFHAGTKQLDGNVVTSGGRVLAVTALGDSVKMAQKRAYEAVKQIQFEGMQYRKDIGFRAIDRKK